MVRLYKRLCFAGLLILLLAACEDPRDQSAASGTRPAIHVPIGPSPGPDPKMRFSESPFSEDRVALQEGRKLFVWFNCAGCHGDHGGGGMGPSLRDAVWIYGSSDAHVFSSIAQGRAHGMPSWGTKLPEEQIWKLVAYIKSMRTPLEQSPPPDNPSWTRPGPDAARD